MRNELVVAEDIVPLGEFKVQASRYLRQIQQNNRPIVVTQNGRPAAVVLSPAEFDRLNQQFSFIKAVNQGLEDIEKGNVFTDEEVWEFIDSQLEQSEEK